MAEDQPGYRFSSNWFDVSASLNWTHLVPKLKPRKALEIGSYEGASAAFLIEHNDWCDGLELWCIDLWNYEIEVGGGTEAIEGRFDHNMKVAQARARKSSILHKAKGPSGVVLPQLLAGGHAASFDFVYVDGSHEAADVLFDAVLAFKLAKIGGVIAFDDYLWFDRGRDLLRSPKVAVDAFTSIFLEKTQILPKTPLYQLYVQKTAE